jgi:hypothetical protein
MIQTTAQPSKRRAANTAARKSADRVKSTIVMSGSVDFRLGAIAASLRVDRSALAAKLIDEGLKRYSLDAVLRQFSDRQESAGDVSRESPETVAAA